MARWVRSAALAALLAICACAAHAPPSAPGSPLEARYRLRGQKPRGSVAVSTSVYRQFLARSLFAHCKMVPGDSEMFDVRARRCGALRAAVAGISRLLLERAATPRYLRPIQLDGRLRWLDLPGASPCD